MLSDNKNKLVELFLDNIIWGNITLNHDEIAKHINDKTMKAIANLIERWMVSHESDRNFPITSVDMTDTLYRFFMANRFTSGITGELKDRDGEAKLRKLQDEINIAKQEIKDLTSNLIKAKHANTKLHDENITLANELEDRRKMIDTYERSARGS